MSPRTRRFLASWTERSLLPALLALALLVDIGLGLVWTFTDQDVFSAAVYDTAQQIMPMWGYGILLLVVSLGACAIRLWKGKCWLFGYLVGCVLGGMWGLWTCLFAYDAWPPWDEPQASLTLAVLAAFTFAVHLLTGLTVIRAAAATRPG